MSLTFEYTESPSYSIYDRLIHGDKTTSQVGMPEGPFYLTQGLVVPFSYYPTNFTLSTDNLDDSITIQVSRIGLMNIGSEKKNMSRITMIPPLPPDSAPSDYVYITNIKLQLSKGKNEINVTQGGYTTTLIITATYFGTLLSGYADELFNYSTDDYQRQYDAINSPVATRLVEPFLTIGDLLPDVQTLQLLASKMAIRQYVSEQGGQDGVTDFLAGLVQSTPYFKSQKNLTGLDPVVQSIFRSQEDFSGVEAHVWIPNVSIVKWQAFIKFVNNIKTVYTLNKVTEDEIVVEVDGSLRSHIFDFDSEESFLFFIENEKSCYDSLHSYISMSIKTAFTLCAAAYTFDLIININNPLYGFELDYANFSGLSLTGRLDGGLSFDTMVAKEFSGSCTYQDSYYTQVPLLLETEVDAPCSITVTGSDALLVLGVGFGVGSYGSGEYSR